LAEHTQECIVNFADEGWNPDRDIDAVHLVWMNIPIRDPRFQYGDPFMYLDILRTVSDMTTGGKSFDEISKSLKGSGCLESVRDGDQEASEFVGRAS
jgi:hypothetical protein